VAPLPAGLDELGPSPVVAEKLMPVLGVVRSPRSSTRSTAASWSPSTAASATPRRSTRRRGGRRRFAERIRTGRILVNAPTAVGALGGVYNAMTPTFSLGCGTWGGSTTTTTSTTATCSTSRRSRAASAAQWFRVPSDTYFNAGALDSLRELRSAQRCIVTDAGTERAASSRGAPHLRRAVRSSRRRARAIEQPSAPACASSDAAARPDRRVGGGSVLDAAKAMRLFHETPSSRSRAAPAVPGRPQARRALPADRAPISSSPCHHAGHRVGGLAAAVLTAGTAS
jgi:acetaldehyde dehydrogenase/alcohol dehydrogenase